MRHLPFECQNAIHIKALRCECGLESAIAADRHRLGILNLFERFQQRSTGIILVCQKIAFDLHSGKSVRGVRMCRHGLHICFQTGDGIFRCFNLLREVTQKIVLLLILLTLMAGAHQPQAGNVHIQVHLFLDALVTGTQRLDLCVGQRRFVNVLTGAYRRFGGHNLRDESLLIFNRLPEVGVERSLGHIAVNMHFLVAVALTDDAAAALLQIARPPRAVEVMQRDEPVLDVHTRTHLKGAAHQDAHLPGAHLCKQLFFADFGVCLMDVRNLFAWNPQRNQLAANIVIDGKRHVRRYAVAGKLRFQCVKLRVIERAASRFFCALGGCDLGRG